MKKTFYSAFPPLARGGKELCYRLLTEAVIAGLERDDFTVLTHSLVPPNDGGLSLGQAAVVAARLQTTRLKL